MKPTKRIKATKGWVIVYADRMMRTLYPTKAEAQKDIEYSFLKVIPVLITPYLKPKK